MPVLWSMTKLQRKKLAAKLADHLQTVSALVRDGQRSLGSIPEDDRTIEDWARNIQLDLEDAERLLAVTAQDVADLV